MGGGAYYYTYLLYYQGLFGVFYCIIVDRPACLLATKNINAIGRRDFSTMTILYMISWNTILQKRDEEI
jgi:hypothetical protein